MCTSRTKNVHTVSVPFISLYFVYKEQEFLIIFLSGSPDFMEVFKGFLCCSAILHILVQSLYLTIFKVIICLFV